MREYDVDFFIRENGDCPVKEFLLALDKKMRAKLLVELDLLEENGPQLREPYSKHLEDGIFELRAKQGSDITRVLYFFFCGKEDRPYKRIHKENPENTPRRDSDREKIPCGIYRAKGELLMSDFRKFLDEQLEDPEFKAEWDALQPERALVQAMIDARKRTGMTQQQLAEKTGISQSDISKFETGGGNPSIKTLQRLAAGMGMILQVEFKPAAGTH